MSTTMPVRTSRLTRYEVGSSARGLARVGSSGPYSASRLAEYGPEDPTLASPRAELPTSYLVSLDVRTGIVVDITPLDGDAGSGLVNVIHAVDAGTLDARPSGDRAPHGDGVRGGR